ncbi:MAG: glucose-6-phosphate isomerase [Pseudomonadota bacterium]
MTLSFNHSGCLSESVGNNGLTQTDLAGAQERLDQAVTRMRSQHQGGGLALLDMPAEVEDLAGIDQAAAFLTSGASDIVVLGTGGSSLGGQTLAQIGGWRVPGAAMVLPRLHFFDNLDPLSLEQALSHLLPETTRYLIVSKSGGTGETLLQAMAVLDHLGRSAPGRPVGRNVVLLTEPERSPGTNKLRALFAGHDVLMLEHHTGIGGRYAGLTNVGLIPAKAVGLDPQAIRSGAARAVAPILQGADTKAVPSAQGALLAALFAERHGLAQSVVLAYSDRLERFTRWFVQLWSESLGKQGRGLTPIPAVGPVDQHSQLQLFLDGPRDKLTTVILVETAGQGPRIDAKLAEQGGEPGFAGTTIGDFVWSQQRGTVDTLIQRGRPVRTITVPAVTGEIIGELMMHFMLETILTADLLGVDAFDQPAVEDGKVLAKRYLAEAMSAQ